VAGTQESTGRLPRAVVLRACLLVLLVLAGTLVALLVDAPDVAGLRGWLASLGALGWAGLLVGLALVFAVLKATL